ncbi:hypothetical protein F4561_005375 [Lipingzhangella halophila]|uniref:Uncharacterized protein n=1 Tax=Lipingzhangella halophila TaxID=1783352 RepID=A0A7W7RM69_9ACTN|nr:hypothetical protein [Lipingzhangella halophila]MBB4934555.1 hypothetical protein [Lipingzhangella halophila]
MGRGGKRVRRLVAGGQTFLWTVRHEHQEHGGGYRGCRETLAIRLLSSNGRLLIVFHASLGRLVPDGYLHSGAVRTSGGAVHNLHAPGTVRTLLDEACAVGWRPEGSAATELDGWTLLDNVASRGGRVPPA